MRHTDLCTNLTTPARAKWQKPDQVVRALNLKPGQTIVDIGAGTGYFTRRFARAVGPTGMAIGLDIEPGMVAYMKADAAPFCSTCHVNCCSWRPDGSRASLVKKAMRNN